MTLRTRPRPVVAEFGTSSSASARGNSVLLRDVATVEDGMAEAETKATSMASPQSC